MRRLLLLLLVPAVAACKNSSSYDSGRPVSPGTGLVWEDQPNGILAVNFGSQTGTVAEGDRLARLEKQLASLRTVSNLLVATTNDSFVEVRADALQVGGDLLTGIDLVADTSVLGAGGVDAALQPETWYGVLVVTSAGGSSSAAMLSANPAAPALPAGYTAFRRVSWARVNGASHLHRFRQTDRFVHYLPDFASGDAANEAKKRIAENQGNTNLQPIVGFSADDPGSVGGILPPGVREMFVTTLMTTVGIQNADVLWNQNGPTGTAPDPNAAHRRLARCQSLSTGVGGVCGGTTWVTLNGSGRFFAATNGNQSSYTIDVEAYLDEGI